ERWTADPLREVIDIIWQVVAAGFFAALDQNDTARMRDPLIPQCQQRAQRSEHRISVIGPAAAVELVAFETRDPGTITLRPPHHLRLLVEMAIEQHSVCALAGDLDENDRSAPRQPDDFEGGARQGWELRLRPALEQRDGFIHIAAGCPVG